MDELQKIKVKKSNGEETEAEVLLCFELEKTGKKYILYTFNEVDDKNMETIHASILNENKDIYPAIIITKKDHEKTRSNDKKLSSLKFQKSQKKLINEKKYTQAFENEKNDIISNFGSRYNKQLNQVENYVQTLIGDGVVDDSGR